MRYSAAIFVFASAAAAAEPPSFARAIMPVFAKYCISCHAGGVKMGSLDLESFDTLMKGGHRGAVIVPGKSGESRLYQMLTGAAKPVMPMDGSKLAAGEIELIRNWIDAGARGPAAGEVVPKPSETQAKVPVIKPKNAVPAQIYALAYSPDGRTIAAGEFQQVRLLDIATRAPVASLSGQTGAIRGLAFSRDGKLLAAAGGAAGRRGEVWLWDMAQRKPVVKLEGHGDAIYAVAFSPDGKLLATSSYDKLIKIWDTAAGKELRTLKDHIDAVYALAFAPDGRRLISGAADRTLKIWDPATGQRLFTLGEPTDGVNTLAIHPGGKLVAAAGLDKTIRIWSLAESSGRLVNTLIAHEDQILKLAWSPDGATLVSSAADRAIKVFKAADLTEVKSLSPQPDWAYAIEFSPDGKWLAAGRYDGSLSIYDTQKYVDPAETRRAAR